MLRIEHIGRVYIVAAVPFGVAIDFPKEEIEEAVHGIEMDVRVS